MNMCDKLYLNSMYYYARLVMWNHGISNWKLRLSTQTSYLGLTCYNERTIYISIYYIMNHSFGDVMTLLCHEIAHALTEHEKRPHGPQWKKKYLDMGGTGMACTYFDEPEEYYRYNANCTRCDFNRRCHIRYLLHCPDCGSWIKNNDNPKFKELKPWDLLWN